MAASDSVRDPVFATPATFPGGAPKTGEKNNWRGLLIFFGPAAILLLVFLIFPTIYTILLSFNRGRRGEFTNWVGLDNFTTLFTNDPNFINLSTFPPSGAVWNNVLWIIFYTGFVLGLGLLIATLASRVRYESIIKAAVFLPQAVAATALAVIWKFVYAPGRRTSASSTPASASSTSDRSRSWATRTSSTGPSSRSGPGHRSASRP